MGTITEALDAHKYAVDNHMISITSGRSGGVVGDVVMDLAVGLQIGFIKNGCPRSGERIDKLNFLGYNVFTSSGNVSSIVTSNVSDHI